MANDVGAAPTDDRPGSALSRPASDMSEAETVAYIKRRDTREASPGKAVRDALNSLQGLITDPNALCFLFESGAIEQWRVLRDQDPHTFAVHFAEVRRRNGYEISQLLARQIGVPGSASGSNAGALPLFAVSAVWEGYTPTPYYIKNVVEPRAVTTIFGDQGTYKSFIAIAAAGSMSTARTFYGIRSTKQPVGVLYLVGEGGAGIRKRIRAWMMNQGLTAADPQPLIAVTELPANLMEQPAQLRDTVQAAERLLGVPIEVIVIDTLSANFGKGEENSAADMMLAIANAKRAAPDAAIVVVHHSGHGDGGRERGSSALPFGADLRFRTKYDKAARLIEFENLKQKDDETLPTMYFSPRRVGVEWLDTDGEELTSIVLDRVESPPPVESSDQSAAAARTTPKAGIGKNQETVLKILQRLYRNHRKNVEEQGRDPNEARVLVSGLRSAVVDENHMVRQRYNDAIAALIERGVIAVEEPFVYLVTPS